MKSDELQRYIEENIPLVAKAGFVIEESTCERVSVHGPFPENRNHHGSVFGGSISVISVLAGWLLVREIMEKENPQARIVISSQTLEYLRPLRKDFIAEAVKPDISDFGPFLKRLDAAGKARLEVQVLVREEEGSEPCARFQGTFHVAVD
ncbi:YiiD C-terminal domain-containing protein [Spirochaeta isovalerica]|uniref:Thioesterase domain-containing protein n=1 Tax=Spirochaeta isovalerica TaxID=150 RepID=A0A841R7S2_9SPIO|nr:YiiD C-terminal domain-containing protein [Spirochaeta isovalerica]MBB6481324.1 thioesterase domain-containing protein [Spirochaeta isovalerica]